MNVNMKKRPSLLNPVTQKLLEPYGNPDDFISAPLSKTSELRTATFSTMKMTRLLQSLVSLNASEAQPTKAE
jgi:hypothetical protein